MSSTHHDATFVTPAWLNGHLRDPRVVPVDASFFLPDEGKDADALFARGHIPGAVRFDVDAVADQGIDLPHMLPEPSLFAKLVGALGISNEDQVVIYDSTDLLGGARAWWMFRHYGATNVHMLEGGFRAWEASGYPVETGPAKRAPATFVAHDRREGLVDAEAVLAAAKAGSHQIVDARAAARFAGSVPEPRPGLRSGHIPGSLNVPWRKLVDETGLLRSPDEIELAFKDAGVDIDKPIVTSCGSGVSAAILILGLEQLGRTGVQLYDGSWAEWGGRHDLPIETGPARAGVQAVRP